MRNVFCCDCAVELLTMRGKRDGNRREMVQDPIGRPKRTAVSTRLSELACVWSKSSSIAHTQLSAAAAQQLGGKQRRKTEKEQIACICKSNGIHWKITGKFPENSVETTHTMSPFSLRFLIQRVKLLVSIASISRKLLVKWCGKKCELSSAHKE